MVPTVISRTRPIVSDGDAGAVAVLRGGVGGESGEQSNLLIAARDRAKRVVEAVEARLHERDVAEQGAIVGVAERERDVTERDADAHGGNESDSRPRRSRVA